MLAVPTWILFTYRLVLRERTARNRLPIETGAITASLDASGRVVITDFGLGLATLALHLISWHLRQILP